ncbi:MAG: M17 family peptidase N-terminal domain-containing protein [Sandaracinaceae bacterium]
MEVRFVPPDLRRLDELGSEALALCFFEDERPLPREIGLVDWRLCGAISKILLRGRASGALGETVLLPARPRLPFEKLFLFGVGRVADFDDAVVDGVIERMLTTLDRAFVRTSVVSLPGRCTDRIAPEHAMKIFLGRAAMHPEQDSAVVIEPADAQRAMMPVVERERRRERAELL